MRNFVEIRLPAGYELPSDRNPCDIGHIGVRNTREETYRGTWSRSS